jgi:holo-[acyl-carrier protein] synthase
MTPSLAPAHGIDLVHLPRFRAVFGDRPERWSRVFTAGELADVAGRRDPVPGLAARFAAKEATCKALGAGLTSVGIDRRLRSIEVRRPGGAPTLHLHGAMARRASARGLGAASVSLTHDGDYAFASVLFVRQGAPA